MDDELVLLTSYFNLVEGRQQDEADTFRVDTELQSASSPDGSSALYIITEASTGGHVGPRARRLAADTIAWEYASHGEDPPVARLKAALRVAHEELRREFEGTVAIGVTVMAVERDTVFLVQVAPSHVYVLHEGGLNSVPAAIDSASPFARALGSDSGPRISVFRDQIAPGDVVSLCSTWFDRAADANEVRECFSGGTSDEIAESLLALAQEHNVRDATAIVVEAALSTELEMTPTGDEPPTFMQQVDIAVQALANVGRMLWYELQPTPDGESPGEPVEAPREPVRTATSPPGARPVPSADATASTAEVPLVPSDFEARTEPLPSAEGGKAASEPRYSDFERVEREPWGGEEPSTPLRDEDPFADTEYMAPRLDVPVDEVSTPRNGAHSVRDEMTEEVPRVPPTPPSSGSSRSPLRRVAPPTPAPNTTPPADSGPAREEDNAPAPEPVPDPRPVVTERETVVTRRPEPAPELEDEEAPMLSELERVNSRLNASQDMAGVIPPVEAFEDTGTEPARIYATNKDIQAVNRRPRRFGGAGSVPVIRPGMGDIDLRQPVNRATPPALVWASLAVLLIFIAGALGLFVKRQLAHRPHTNPYIALVAQDLSRARTANTPANQDYYLGRASKNLALAQQNGASATWAKKERRAIQTESDTVHHVTRETSPVLLTDFSRFPGSGPSQIATGPGVVYVVDPKRKSAFSVAAKPNAAPTALLQSGQTFSGFAVSVPQLVASDGNIALILDDKNQLFRATGGTITATDLPQLAQSPAHYVAMTTLDPDVYVLDTAGSQVWRYPYGVSGYNPRQAAYWDSNPPKLANGLALAFDKTSLYILRGDGSVLKYDLQANPQQFSINLKTPISKPVAFYTDPNQRWVWIADAGTGRIIQLNKDGTYSRTYVSATGGLDLSKTASISVGPDGNTLYVLAGSRLYDFPVQQ